MACVPRDMCVCRCAQACVHECQRRVFPMNKATWLLACVTSSDPLSKPYPIPHPVVRCTAKSDCCWTSSGKPREMAGWWASSSWIVAGQLPVRSLSTCACWVPAGGLLPIFGLMVVPPRAPRGSGLHREQGDMPWQDDTQGLTGNEGSASELRP